MKTSAESMTWYNKTNSTWRDIGNDHREQHGGPLPCDFNTAKRYVRKMWRDSMGYRLPYDIKQTSGNRYTWVRRKVLYINCDQGWREINHLFSHWIGYRKNFSRPHCAEHACLEWRGMNLIRDKFLAIAIVEHNKPPQVVKQKDIVLERYNRMLAREKKWIANSKRAATHLAKVKKQIKAYEQRHRERISA